MDMPVGDYEAALEGAVLPASGSACRRNTSVDPMPEAVSTLWRQGEEWLEGGGRGDCPGVAAAHQVCAAGLLYCRARGGVVQPRPLRWRSLRPARSGEDIAGLYEESRAAGFGDEVKRRILIGTYVRRPAITMRTI